MRKKSGFTLVELLIVIVIIAILAVLSLVAYNGITNRANNTVTISNVSEYANAIELYNSLQGYYPPAPGEGDSTVAMTCLGLGYTGGSCGKITGTDIYESDSFMKDLAAGSDTDISDIVNSQFGNVGNESFVGAAYGIDTTDADHSSTGRARMIEWFLRGKNQNCTLPNSWAYNTSDGNTACELDLEEY